MPSLSMRIQFKFLLLVLLGALPAVLVLVLLGKAYYHEATEQAEQTLLIQAQRLAEQHQAAIDRTKYILAALAQHPVLQAMDNPACEALLAQQYTPLREVLANLLVLRPDGQVACNAKAPEKHHRLDDRLYYQRAVARGDFAVGDYMIGRTTGTPVLGMAYPLVREGKTVMLTATSIELGLLSEVSHQALYGQDLHLTIIDRHGAILLHAHGGVDEGIAGQNIADTPLGRKLLELGPAGTSELPDLEGEPTLFAHIPLGPEAEPYAYLALGLPLETLAERYKTLERSQLAGALLALVLGLSLASLALTHFLHKRLRPLIEAVRQIREGKAETLALPSGVHDELGELSTAFNDMSSTLASQRNMLLRLAHHDPLTGLPNRLLFAEQLEHAIQVATREKRVLALLFLDLDHFKTINDSLGHALGDQLLKAVAQRLQEQLREEDMLARMGGDEFTLLLENIEGPWYASLVAERLLGELSKPFEVSDNTLFVTASIGIALYPSDGEDAQLLIQRADAALYKSKAEGRNNAHFFSDDLEQAAAERLRMEAGLRQVLDLHAGEAKHPATEAVERGELLLHYQPQIRLSDEGLIGMEALARWHHPEWGWVSPARFIPVAEDSGLIVKLGQWALREACRQFKTWRKQGLPVQYVAVNISAVQLRFGNLVKEVRDTLHEFGIAGHHLELEITESAILHAPEEVIRKLNALRKMGVRLAIDDFGTGYSSLAYLKRLPLDRIKIDQGFVRDMLTDPQDEAIVRAVIALGHSMDLEVLAEGVETAEHATRLRELGCESAQGYYFGRPAAGEAFPGQD
ncbi:MAG: EAL domain-containing protein [Pseudomonadota bacterium]